MVKYEIPDEITVSDLTFKAATVQLVTFDGNVRVFVLYNMYENEYSYVKKSFMYANKDANIFGAIDYGDGKIETYSVYLKKGWNEVYMYEQEDAGNYVYGVTTTVPNVPFEWYLVYYYLGKPVQKLKQSFLLCKHSTLFHS